MQNNETNKEENGYRSILKGTSILGGVQVFQIIINLLRGKFVAMFLGPEGMGISSLFNSSSNTLIRFSSLGINLAIVKDVAANKENQDRLATVRYVSTLLIQLTALLGAVACALLSPWLSRISFGTTDYAWQFVALSLAVYLTTAGNGNLAILQGLHKVKLLSTTSLAGALSGLVAGVPLYYFFGDKGIVPAMIILALTTYVFYAYGVRKSIPRAKIKFNRSVHFPLMKHILSLGFIMLVATLINTLCTYIINIFVRNYGDLADVGLFNAANSITLQYAGVVFAAMAMDYFPRLTAAANDNQRMSLIINRQMEIVALMAAPLSILLVATAPIVIRLLLTSQFLPVTGLMRWLGISILLKAIAYPLGYITFAKNNRSLFFWLEGVVCNALYLGLSLLFYHLFGLMGLGYAAVIEQGACVLLYLCVNFKVYGFYPDVKAWSQTVIAIMLGAAAFCASLLANSALSYSFMSLVLAVSLFHSFMILRGRMRRGTLKS